MRAATNPETSPQWYVDDAPETDPVLDAAHLQQHNYRERKPRSLNEHADSENALEPHGAANGDRVEDTHRKGHGGLLPVLDIDEHSKWIHRDKLARIESEELQAAGIFLPRQRDRARSKSQNRPKRDQSQDQLNGSSRSIGGSEHTGARSRKNSAATTTDMRNLDLATVPSWDLRRPEEILEEGDGHSLSNSSGKGSSRIPVAKVSPVPIPSEHLARDTPLARKRDGSPGVEDTITYPKQRARSGSTGNTLALAKAGGTGSVSQPNKRPDSSPKKPTTAATTRKPKPANGAAGRPKTRGGPSKDSTSSGRPSTRSAEREFSSRNRPCVGELREGNRKLLQDAWNQKKESSRHKSVFLSAPKYRVSVGGGTGLPTGWCGVLLRESDAKEHRSWKLIGIESKMTGSHHYAATTARFLLCLLLLLQRLGHPTGL